MRVLLLLLAGCVVTRPPWPRERPKWQLDEQTLDVACATARPLVRKSGKQGIGMTLQVKSRGDCDVKFTAARLRFNDGQEIAVAPPPSTQLPGWSLTYLWWPIAFDNNAAWNAHRTRGELHVDYAIGEANGTWKIAMGQQ